MAGRVIEVSRRKFTIFAEPGGTIAPGIKYFCQNKSSYTLHVYIGPTNPPSDDASFVIGPFKTFFITVSAGERLYLQAPGILPGIEPVQLVMDLAANWE